MSKKNIIFLIVVASFLTFCILFVISYGGGEEQTIGKKDIPSNDKPIAVSCEERDLEVCDDECVICPPCPACSSISCQTEEYCAGMGIDRGWYERVRPKITNFKECAEAGNAIMESYPQKCRSGEETFIEQIGNELEKKDLIRIDQPRPNGKIASPLIVKGEARGYWFFEGSFPFILTDLDSNIIATGIATAEGAWMTEDFVKFQGMVNFKKPEHVDAGSLILRRDNPTGLPENDDALELPVIFK